MSASPLISACVITYNQAAFIEETIKGVCAQQIEGPYEIVIGDDYSTDNTLEIIAESTRSHPFTRILTTEKNLGMHGNWARTIGACNGKYIALCEGDDVWNDPLKLQKQINLLEENPDAVACFSNANILDYDGSFSRFPYVDDVYDLLNAHDFFNLQSNPIPTCSLVFRRSNFNGFPAHYYNSPFADWILHTILIQQGDYVYLNESSCSYRKHVGGVWSSLKQEKQLINKLSALFVIKSLIRDEFKYQNLQAIRKQLDAMLYFYRDNNLRIKFLSTWLKLKTL